MTVLTTVLMRARTATLLGVGGAYAALQLLGRQAGSTREERAAALRGDDLVNRPQMRTDHAVTIDAPPDYVWPWLTQMGWHLAGWYTPRCVDRLLFPDNWTALDHLDPHLVRDLRVGDTIPDGPPGTAQYVVAQAEPPHRLVLHSTTHIPPGWDTRYGVEFVWTWSLNPTPLPGERTRVHLRVRGRGRPWWFIGLYVAALIPADYVMATGMLRGLKQRVEAHPQPFASGRTPWSGASPSTARVIATQDTRPPQGPPPGPWRGQRAPPETGWEMLVMFTIRNLGGVALLLMGSTWLWLTPAFAGPEVSTSTVCGGSPTCCPCSPSRASVSRRGGSSPATPGWEAAALGSAAVGAVALVTFLLAALPGGEPVGAVTWNIVAHVCTARNRAP